MSLYPYISNIKCKNCQGDIIIKRSRDKNNEFCGTACVGKFNKKKDEFTNCTYCQNKFKKSNKTKNKFCSKDCANKSRKVSYLRNCKRCNKEFESKNIANINRGKDLYCSADCARRRRYDIDENFFSQIDTESKAYILGFIYSDGCLSKNKSEVIIKIHNKDEEILKIIKEELKSDHPIHQVKGYKNKQVCFRFGSKKIYNDLTKIGLSPSKTFSIVFPKLSDNLVRHFIRGYFDGDGCVSKIGKNRKLNLCNIFTASKSFKDSLCEILNFESIEFRLYERDNGFSINIGKKESVYKFHDFMYSNSTIYLNRKYDKYNT